MDISTWIARAMCAALLLTTGAAGAVAQVTDAGLNAGPGTSAAVSVGSAVLSSAQIQAVLDGDWRSRKDRLRDRYRHPAETLKFFGLRSEHTVIEIAPGGGWYTELIAPLVNARGHYIAAVSAPADGQESASARKLKAMFASHPGPFGNAEVRLFDSAKPVLGPLGSADEVLTFRNVHNWTDAGSAPAMFKAFYAVLAPGGVLGVVDHRAAEGSSFAAVERTGYLPTALVIALATDAGFRLDASSEINANPKDKRDHPAGVWTLPPTYSLGDVDRAKYEAIGESDRMTLRFVKPAT